MACSLGAFLLWSSTVFYFKAIEHVSPAEILAHRIVWSALLFVGLLVASRRLSGILLAVREPRTAFALLGTTCLQATSWFTFVWAIGHERVLETSMGYFISPLVAVALGALFLRERLSVPQLLAVLLAGLAVALLWIHGRQAPLIPLVLAFCFGFYGLLRKTARVEPVVGLAFETAALSPLAVGYMLHLSSRGSLVFLHAERLTDVLLLSAGLVTAIPLLLFLHGARRLRYATLGMLQYSMPTLTFLIAVFVYAEPLDALRLIAFGMIWLAVLVYCVDAWGAWPGRARYRPKASPTTRLRPGRFTPDP